MQPTSIILEYIKQQPAVWQAMLANSQGYTGLKLPKGGKLLLLGSGSSHYATLSAAEFFGETLGIEAVCAVPTRCEEVLRFLPPEKCTVVTVSQSGKSTSTLAILLDLKARGYSITACTADEASPIASMASQHILIGCGEEKAGPKTKGMTGSILALYLVGIDLALSLGTISQPKADEICAALATSFSAAAANIEKCEAFCQNHLALLASRPSFTLIADDHGLPAALEGALKILETLYVPAGAYEFEEYLHGVNCTIGPDATNLLMPVLPRNVERMQLLHSYCKEHGGQSLMVAPAHLGIQPAGDILTLEGSGQPYTTAFESLLLHQVISVYGSAAKGVDPAGPKFPDFHARLATKTND